MEQSDFHKYSIVNRQYSIFSLYPASVFLCTTVDLDFTALGVASAFDPLSDRYSMNSPGIPRNTAPHIVKISKLSFKGLSQGERRDMDLNTSH